MSSVLPGVALVMASLGRLVSMLIRLDLPTLDRPMKAYSGNWVAGHFSTFVLLMTNSALRISTLFLIYDSTLHYMINFPSGVFWRTVGLLVTAFLLTVGLRVGSLWIFRYLH